MWWKSIFAVSGGIFILALNPCEAQTSSVPSFRSPTCNAICDLVTAIKEGLPSAQRAAELKAAESPVVAAPPKSKPRVKAARRAKAAAPKQKDEFRIYANPDVKSLADLRGQPVSLGLNGSRSQSLARKTLAEAGVTIQELPLDTDNAFDAMNLGVIGAMAVSGESAYAMMDRIPARFGVHRIQIPRHGSLAKRSIAQGKTASLSLDGAK